MEKTNILNGFSRRLTQAMQKAGYGSDRSRAGIDIKKLSKITGCSYQMARKYALGEALPESLVIAKIATCLNISPGWLLFGENDSDIPAVKRAGAIIEIEPELLKYILNKSYSLFFTTSNQKNTNIINFIVGCIYDVSHLNTNIETIYKIIDMMFSSASIFSEVQEKDHVTRKSSGTS